MLLLLSLFIAISPTIALLFYFYKQDCRQGKSYKTKIKVFLLGIKLTIPAVLLELAADDFLNSGKLQKYFLHPSPCIPLSDALLWGFLGSGAIEEGIKLLYVFLFVKNLKELTNQKEVIFYLVILGLGFATLENISYLILFDQSGLPIFTLILAFARALLSIPAHIICAVVMGFFVGRYKFSNNENKNILLLGAWGSATLIHGTFNTLAFIQNPFSLSILFLIVIVGVGLAIKLIKNLSKEEKFAVRKSRVHTNQANPAETQLSVRDYAKQGNPKAIAALITRSLSAKGITAKASLKDQCLRIILEAHQVPQQQPTVQLIHQGLIKLNAQSIKTVTIYGRQLGQDFPAWSQDVGLVVQAQGATHNSPQTKLVQTNLPLPESPKRDRVTLFIRKLNRSKKLTKLVSFFMLIGMLIGIGGYVYHENVKKPLIYLDTNSDPLRGSYRLIESKGVNSEPYKDKPKGINSEPCKDKQVQAREQLEFLNKMLSSLETPKLTQLIKDIFTILMALFFLICCYDFLVTIMDLIMRKIF